MQRIRNPQPTEQQFLKDFKKNLYDKRDEPDGLNARYMRTVKTQKEDAPYDMDCHVDSEGNKFDFGYGLKSVINDKRAAKYKDKL